jgi:hypothetical protein
MKIRLKHVSSIAVNKIMKYHSRINIISVPLSWLTILAVLILALAAPIESLADDCGDECGCESAHCCLCDICLPLPLMIELSDNILPVYFDFVFWPLPAHSSFMDQEWFFGIDHPPRIS